MKTVFNSARCVATHDSEEDDNMDAKKVLTLMIAAL